MNRRQLTGVVVAAAAVLIAAVALIVVVLSGRGGKSSPPAAGATTTAPVTTAPAPSSTAPTTVAATTSSSGPPSVVGLAVDGSGTTFSPPGAATTVPFTQDCTVLVDPGFYGQCLTVVSPTGTIAAIVEQQQRNYQRGQPITANQERDLVYRRQGTTYQLVLRRTPAANGSAETQLYQSDVNRDGDPKAVFIIPAPNSQFGTELDVVEGTGVVSLVRQLHGGFAGIAAGGGLDSFVPSATQGYDETVIRYRTNAWHIVSDQLVSQAQAQSQNAQPFNDPKGSTPG